MCEAHSLSRDLRELMIPEISAFSIAGRCGQVLLLFAFLLGASAATHAQTTSGIAGVASDSSGAVMPGVTVTITSPAMIEGSRTTTTDTNGQYRFTDLRPGAYTVTFTKTGFQTVRRENVTLTASFTATVDGTMPVGTTVTQVTVSEAAPLVDVQNSVAENVLTRQVLDTIPTGKDPFSEGQTLPGVTTDAPDTGGLLGMQQPNLQVHGSSSNDNVFFVDGMWIQHVAFNGNQTGFYFNDGLMQDISYQFSVLPAEAPVGGVEINMVPRDGGNQFHGGLFSTAANGSMESDNNNASLRALGLVAQNKVDTVYDINAHFGGPVIRNKLWFFSTFRRWGANNYLANTFTPEGTQALNDNRLTDITLRLTWQASKKNKFSVSYDRGFKFRGHRFNNFIGAQFSDPLADVVQKSWLDYMAQVKWTSTLTNRLLLQAGYTLLPVNYNLGFEPGVTPGTIAEYDQVTSTILKASPRVDNDRGTMQTYMASIAYVTGAHNLKTGIEARYGWFQEAFTINGDQTLILDDGTPTAVQIYNTPLAHREDVNPDFGWYLQDTWQIARRLSINPGIRFDHLAMNIPAQSGGGGLWTPVRHDPATNGIVNWNSFSPRFGFAWDVFGNSKTAIKGGISKYERLEGSGLAQNVNPNFIETSTCPWNSFAEALPSTLDQTTCTGFSGFNQFIDPHMKRPYQWEYTVMLQRQIGANTAVSVGYYGRRFYDLFQIENTAVPPSDYTPVTIPNPLGGTLTVYNQNAATIGNFNIVEKTIPSLTQYYNGVEFQVNTHVRNFTMFGGLDIGKDWGDVDGDVSAFDYNNPNNLILERGAINFDSPYQIRAGGSYNLPEGVLFAFTARESSGLPETYTYFVTQDVDPGLNQVNQLINVTYPGKHRLPWQNLVDIRLAKTIKIGERMTLEPSADIFNLFNCSAVVYNNQTLGPGFLQPAQIDFGRLLRLGGRLTF